MTNERRDMDASPALGLTDVSSASGRDARAPRDFAGTLGLCTSLACPTVFFAISDIISRVLGGGLFGLPVFSW